MNALFISAFFLISPSFGQKSIELLGSDELTIDENLGYQRLTGNVQFRYLEHLMYCDSAFIYEGKDEIRAYGKVRIIKTDDLNIYCDSLYFNSAENFSELWGNVRVVDKEYELQTEHLEYDAKKNEAIYRNSGIINHVGNNDRLTSKIGYYFSDTKNFFFRKNVRYYNDDYDIVTDTMQFQSLSNIVLFYGFTTIEAKKDSTTIHCNSGYFDTKNNKGKFIDHAEIIKPPQFVYGDTLDYDSGSQISIGKGNVIFKDTSQKVEFRGDYGIANEKEHTTFLTECALAILYQEKDTTFIHADTLFSRSDTLNQIKRIRANYGVKIYSSSYQGVCDSLTYSSTDSLMKMYTKPVVWSRNSQLTGDSIQVKRSGQGISRAYVYANALAISEVDSGKFYNQIAGRNIVAYFSNQKLNLVHVVGNAKTIYFPEDEKENDTSIIVSRSGMNRLFSSEIKLYLDSGEVQGMTSIEEPDGAFFALDGIPADELRVENFIWRIADRPKKPEDWE